MKLYLTFTRKRMALIFFVILLILLLYFAFLNAKPYINAKTPEQRLDYINGLGYSVEEEPVNIKKIVVPSSFNDFYIQYNSMQKSVGFDLLPYKGCSVMLYGYRLKARQNEEGTINLIVYGGRVIGGDIQKGTSVTPLK